MDKINIDKTSYMGSYENTYNSNISIGKYSSIANNAKFIDADHPWINQPLVSTFNFNERWKIDIYPKCLTQRNIDIGNDVTIGERVTIIAPVKIGDGVVVGAGTVIASDIPPYAIVFGNPCKIYKYRFSVDQINALNRIKWWNWEESTIRERIKDFMDINSFIQKYG